jgi:hypothetical protein
VPTNVEWVGGLKNKPWQTEAEKEYFFQWRMNLSTSLAFVKTIGSCLDTYVHDTVERASLERDIAQELYSSWCPETSGGVISLNCLQRRLEDIQYKKQQQMARKRAQGALRPGEELVGLAFETDLFTPLRRGITVVSRALNFPSECTWILSLDEAEFLETIHHRILNTHLRGHSGNLVFKITTMPYHHYTRDTNTRVSVNVGHDFEYVYIDEDHSTGRGRGAYTFAQRLFAKRASASFPKGMKVTLHGLLGSSRILEPQSTEWSIDSHEMCLLKKYVDDATYARAMRLFSNRKKFRDQIARKLRGALLVREAIEGIRGRGEPDIYSGDLMAIRCSDGNPRRLIRIFNNMLLQARGEYARSDVPRSMPDVSAFPLPRKEQTRVLTSFAASTLKKVNSEALCGPDLYNLLECIGKYMSDALHNGKLSTDQVSSIEVGRRVSEAQWRLITAAVGLGLLFPNIGAKNPDHMPEREGVFRLAHVLAPYFKIVPRRGTAVSLSTILASGRLASVHEQQGSLVLLERSE